MHPNKVREEDVTFFASPSVRAEQVIATMKRVGFAVVKDAIPREGMIFFRRMLDDWYETTRKSVVEGRTSAEEFRWNFVNGISGPLLSPHLQRCFEAVCKTIFPDFAKLYLQTDDI